MIGPSKCPVYIKIPWIGRASQIVADRVALSVMRCYNSVKVRTIFSTKHAFSSSQKDVLPILQQSLMVYKFTCQCDADYIGRTIQRLEVRVGQHVPRAIRQHNLTSTSGQLHAQESTIGEHILDHQVCREKYSDESFSVLHKARNKHHLMALEAISILIYRPSLCRGG